MSIALFYITNCCITFLSLMYFGGILIKDIKSNGHESKYLTKSKNPDNEAIPWIFQVSVAPIINLLVALIVVRMTYSYHQYTLGRTDYNILEEEEGHKNE
jgi:hypothetical protein